MADCAWSVLDLGCDDETRQAVGGISSFTSLYEIVKLAYLQPRENVQEVSAFPYFPVEVHSVNSNYSIFIYCCKD